MHRRRAGCARARLAELVVDRRNHVGGNCHDGCTKAACAFTYGPHYFRTDSDEVLAYLSRFTEWIPGRYVAKVATRGRLFDFR